MSARTFKKRAVSPILGTIVVLLVGLTVASMLSISNTTGSSEGSTIYKLAFTSIYQATPVSVDNAGWQLVLLIENQGNTDNVLQRVYLNEQLIDELGYIHGDALPSGTTIATSIPSGGLTIPPNSLVTVYIWIGEALYSQGTQLTIELQKLNQLELRKTITLN